MKITYKKLQELIVLMNQWLITHPQKELLTVEETKFKAALEANGKLINKLLNEINKPLKDAIEDAAYAYCLTVPAPNNPDKKVISYGAQGQLLFEPEQAKTKAANERGLLEKHHQDLTESEKEYDIDFIKSTAIPELTEEQIKVLEGYII